MPNVRDISTIRSDLVRGRTERTEFNECEFWAETKEPR